MRISLTALIAAITVCMAAAWGQSIKRDAHIGYLYPSGGRQETAFYIIAGGQNLRGVSEVYLSGEGVSATVVRYMGRVRRLNRSERRELQRRLDELKAESSAVGFRDGGSRLPTKNTDGKKRDNSEEEVVLPNHPLLNDLDKLSPPELEFVENEFLRANTKAQPNAQIAETVLIEVTIDPAAPPGDRELRLQTALGLSNPMCFQVGLVPEFREQDPYDPGAVPSEPLELPVLLNGQIKPGDVDRFSIRAEQGQQLVIETHARHLIPYLADAVPGWFQATLTVFDSEGNEVAFADDYRFNPDPVLFYEIPETGLYELEVRDSIYRGREDFIYRITVGEHPFIKSMFPLGGQSGSETVASIDGWNLTRNQLPLDTEPDGEHTRRVALNQVDSISNFVTYAVDTLPECDEKEYNDTKKKAQKIDLPQIINGRITAPGDEDFFKFYGQAGREIVAEVHARRLHSPLDSLVRLIDKSGRLIAWNDDYLHKDGYLHRDMGTITHHADSYLRAKLPRSGIYYMQLIDSQQHGGEAYGYRLRISNPRPDFALHVTPSSITMRAGLATPISVHALRKDGFEGEIVMNLKDAPPGFMIQGGVVQAGCDRVRMTLTMSRRSSEQPVSLCLEGSARIDGKTITRPAIPSEEMMQAFLYRHLVPSQELVVSVTGKYRFPVPELASDSPVQISAGGSARVRFNLHKRSRLENLTLEIQDPPEGLILKNTNYTPGLLTFVLKADGDAMKDGYAGNLIIEAFTERTGRSGGSKKEKKNQPKQLVSLGVLPAIPIRVVKR